MKRQKDMTLEDTSPRLEDAIGEELVAITNSSREKENGWAKVEMTLSCGCYLVVKAKSDGIKNNIA